MVNMSKLASALKFVVLLFCAGLFCVGCVPIDITKTITVDVDTSFLQLTPGAVIPDSFSPDPISVCDKVPEEYQDVNSLIATLLGEVGMASYAQYISIDSLSVEELKLSITDGSGSFDGLTEISGSIDGAYAFDAVPGDGISSTEIDLIPAEPIDVLTLLDECPYVTGSIKGAVPEDFPDKVKCAITIHVKANIGLT